MLPFLIPALVAGGASLISGLIQGGAQATAAGKQADAAQAGINEQRDAYSKIQDLLNPYVKAGTSSLSAQLDLIGLNGSDAQARAVESLNTSPEMTALVKSGETGILANASATGGLRGGNTQAALAQFRPQMLAELINRRYNQLGGIAAAGQNAATNVGTAGQNSANQIAALLTQQGKANAAGALGYGQMLNAVPNAITTGMGTYMGLGGSF
jgi:hypothetical protein